jgi:hypothetical protein
MVDSAVDGTAIKSMPRQCDNQGPRLPITGLLPVPGCRTGNHDSWHTSLLYKTNHIHTWDRRISLAASDTFEGHNGVFAYIFRTSSAIERFQGTTKIILNKPATTNSSPLLGNIYNRIPLFLSSCFFLFYRFLARRVWVCFHTT